MKEKWGWVVYETDDVDLSLALWAPKRVGFIPRRRHLGRRLWRSNRASLGQHRKIERRFEFIQRDFVLEHLHEPTLEALNEAWARWMQGFNARFHSRVFDGHTPSHYYHSSPRRRSKAELQVLLLHEEPRRVYLDSTISYYGHSYRIPPGYLQCRVWTKLLGDTLFIESGGRVIIKHQLAR